MPVPQSVIAMHSIASITFDTINIVILVQKKLGLEKDLCKHRGR